MKPKNDILKTTKYDFLLAGMILIFSFGSIIPMKNIGSMNKKKALIYKNGELKEEINLSIDKTIALHKIRIVTKEGRIRISESDCPHKICMHTGWIDNPSQTIVCVPNKTLIEIVGISDESEYNAISY
jgi:hypothetical protein